MLFKISSGILQKDQQTNNFQYVLRYYKTHYQALKLETSCTTKQIRDAFITLSKEYHPDLNKTKQAHKKFLEINEAYKILGKPGTRRLYDLRLANYNFSKIDPEIYEYRHRSKPFKDPSFYDHSRRSNRNNAYYGINGIKRLPNAVIVGGCIVFCIAGVALQFLAIAKSFTLHRDEMIRKSTESNSHLKAARDAATSNGNVKQLELLKVKLVNNEK